ncbi:MAG: hypothetical protein ACFE8E_08995 [Candidatus Hodarchaeota archaeon]
MSQASWKYLINGSYVMMASIFLPITYHSLRDVYHEFHAFFWIFGLIIHVDGAIDMVWFFKISGGYWLLPITTILIIILGSIMIIVLAIMVKKGKKVKRWIFTLIVTLEASIILINFGFYEFLRNAFFGYLSFLFGLILLVIGNKKYYKESRNSRNILES